MTKKEKEFVSIVWKYYREHGRHTLPWRKTRNPYHVLLSEVMLQQTQVERVLPKYKHFLKTFPSFTVLSRASLGEVLREWQGLGYNRRAKMLHLCAKEIVYDTQENFPKTCAELRSLPGVGQYTAGALMAFVYNEAIPIIETNIRTVFIHHFFNDEEDVSDQELMPFIIAYLDHKNPREWYYALMDYGSYIKKTIGNQNNRSRHYMKQSTFQGSDRQIRGAIIRILTNGSYTRTKLHAALSFESDRIDAQIERLIEEGMIIKRQKSYLLP